MLELLNWDIICGGDESFESHVGNVRFQQILSKIRLTFVHMESKAAKKKLVKDVDEFIQSYGGRFLRVDEATGMLRIMTTAEARNKISRSLRENVSSTRCRKAFITKIGELDVMCGRGKHSMLSYCLLPSNMVHNDLLLHIRRQSEPPSWKQALSQDSQREEGTVQEHRR